MLNKKMLLSVLIIGVVATAAGAGTWAAFSDTETSHDNTFTAGTLDLQLSTDGSAFSDGVSGFSVSNVKPTQTGDLGTITVKNDGNIDGTLSAAISVTEDSEGATANDAEIADDTTATGDLGSAVQITVSDGGSYSYTDYPSALTDMDFGNLAGTSTKPITITYAVDDVGNEIQGDILKFNIEFTLDQA